ncbi:MAG: tRNA pseudouridine(38-40) synthase TruA [Planctomycetes bacterium]|nr:tRNA pseudouridine(38-40) synthase TruA [Planctomycetota bacterium]
MRKLLLTIEYDGTDFHGWQLQPQGRTVQAALERAVKQTTGEDVRVVGAGRTDAGVHAAGQTAHFETESDLAPGRFVPALNHWLPRDVSALHCCEAPRDFDAQRSAGSKLYRYRILRSTFRRPLRERFALRCWHRLDAAPMARCAALLAGEHDFTSFCSVHSEAAGKTRTLLRSELVEDGDELRYHVEADGFLYNMVRIIVGTLLEVGQGKMTPDEFADVLSARDRRAAGPTAAARGLTLMQVRYREDPRSSHREGHEEERG